MANQEHLDILRQGVQAWNQWMDEHSDVLYPDLSGADLHGADLSGANLSLSTLDGADLEDALQLHFLGDRLL